MKTEFKKVVTIQQKTQKEVKKDLTGFLRKILYFDTVGNDSAYFTKQAAT